MAVGADGLGAHQCLPAGARRARQQRVADLLGDRVGLAGQQRLVGLDPPLHDRSVHDDLVAGPHPDQVADDDLVRCHRAVLAVAHHRHGLAGEQLQAVELALGPQLLDGREGRVDDAQPDADQGVAVAAEHQQRDADDEQRVVVEGEDRRPQDPRRGPAGARDRRVGPARARPFLRPRLGQALDDRGRHPVASRPVPRTPT
ncbi:hypothetical protein Acsp06_15580 [Actinomycetospora sp. NBRC 106375]|nr:hypothetical protein Acsp06_15580 [Actinomycetospora sp. NBRC 106375]